MAPLPLNAIFLFCSTRLSQLQRQMLIIPAYGSRSRKIVSSRSSWAIERDSVEEEGVGRRKREEGGRE